MSKINLPTLAHNAARAKQRLIDQEAKVRRLCDQLIERVGTGGKTIKTPLGLVVVTEQTFTRNGTGYTLSFNEEAFMSLDPKLQLELTQKGVVVTQKKVIHGVDPKVQFRLIGGK